MASLSRELARWVHALRYEDLPPAVVDRAKGVTLHCLASVLVGSQTAPGRQAVKLITDEESGVRQGATILVDYDYDEPLRHEPDARVRSLAEAADWILARDHRRAAHSPKTT